MALLQLVHVCALALKVRAQQRLSGDRWWWNFNVVNVNTHTLVLLTGQTRRQPRPSLTPMKASSQPRLWSINSSNRSAHHAHTPSLVQRHTCIALKENHAQRRLAHRPETLPIDTAHLHAMHCTYTRGGRGGERPHLSLHLPDISQAGRSIQQVSDTGFSNCMAVLRVGIHLLGPCAGSAISHSTQPQHGQSGC